jgi:hypothetical protein
MKIIDRLPFGDRPHIVTGQGEAVDVYRNQTKQPRWRPSISDSGYQTAGQPPAESTAASRWLSTPVRLR